MLKLILNKTLRYEVKNFPLKVGEKMIKKIFEGFFKDKMCWECVFNIYATHKTVLLEIGMP